MYPLPSAFLVNFVMVAMGLGGWVGWGGLD